MVPKEFVVNIDDCAECTSSADLFKVSQTHTFNGTANRHLKLKHVQVLPPKPRKVCPRNVLPKRPEILTAGERTKLLRFAHLEDPRKRLSLVNPISISTNDDLETIELMKRKENRKGSFSTINPLEYNSGHKVLQPITGSHQDRLFIQNIKSNHLRYTNSSIIDEKRIEYRENHTSLLNFDSSCNMDIQSDCANVV